MLRKRQEDVEPARLVARDDRVPVRTPEVWRTHELLALDDEKERAHPPVRVRLADSHAEHVVVLAEGLVLNILAQPVELAEGDDRVGVARKAGDDLFGRKSALMPGHEVENEDGVLGRQQPERWPNPQVVETWR